MKHLREGYLTIDGVPVTLYTVVRPITAFDSSTSEDVDVGLEFHVRYTIEGEGSPRKDYLLVWCEQRWEMDAMFDLLIEQPERLELEHPINKGDDWGDALNLKDKEDCFDATDQRKEQYVH